MIPKRNFDWPGRWFVWVVILPLPTVLVIAWAMR
jgi:hypothetical protein